MNNHSVLNLLYGFSSRPNCNDNDDLLIQGAFITAMHGFQNGNIKFGKTINTH